MGAVAAIDRRDGSRERVWRAPASSREHESRLAHQAAQRRLRERAEAAAAARTSPRMDEDARIETRRLVYRLGLDLVPLPSSARRRPPTAAYLAAVGHSELSRFLADEAKAATHSERDAETLRVVVDSLLVQADLEDDRFRAVVERAIGHRAAAFLVRELTSFARSGYSVRDYDRLVRYDQPGSAADDDGDDGANSSSSSSSSSGERHPLYDELE